MSNKKYKRKNDSLSTTDEVKKENVTNHFQFDKDFTFWRNNWWIALIGFIISIGIYAQTANYGYVLDDLIVIEENNYTKKGLAGVGDLMTTESMTGYFGEQKNLVQGNRYRPLSLVTFAIEYEIMDGLNPSISHQINILLYALSVILLLRLMHLLFANHSSTDQHKRWMAIAVAGLFMAHPIHVEAVANIKGRDEIMALLFSLLTLYYAYHHFNTKKVLSLIFANIFFFLGLLSKENTITFLAVIPLTTYFFTSSSLIHSIKKVWPYLISTGLYLALRFSVAGVPQFGQHIPDLMNNPFLEMDGIEKFSTIIYTLGLYVKLLFVPFPLTHDYYPYAIPIMNLGDYQVWLSLLLYLAMIGGGLYYMHKKSINAYAILFYLITLTIVSNMVINLGTFMNDRFVYMSSVGYCIFLVYGVYSLVSRFRKNASLPSWIILSLIGAIYVALTIMRVPDWKDAMTLNRSAIKVSYNSARANTFMSTALFNKGKDLKDVNEKMATMQEALPYALKSIEIHPSYYNGNLMLVGIASEIYKIDNKIDPLNLAFEKVISSRPDIKYTMEFIEYIKDRTSERDKLNNMLIRSSQALLRRNQQHDAGWAIKYLNYAYESDPNNVQINQLLGQAYQLMGDNNKANVYLNRAAALN